MDDEQLILAARAALERDTSDFSADERTELISSIDRNFALDRLDTVSRWALVVALESEAGTKLPDALVQKARTLGELLDEIPR
ncbi:hypothetical protein I6E29_03685 [Arcanobacterium haemolyticum]|nr:hypothetical protein [Arcanobacterium haemolyticum]